MSNTLDQFINVSIPKEYTRGVVTSVKSNGTFLIKTSNGLNLVIRDNTDYIVGDRIILAYTNNSINSAFILKKADNVESSSSVSVIQNDLN